MKESVTYQAILKEGKVEEARAECSYFLAGDSLASRLVLPDKLAKLSVQQFEELALRVWDAESWQALLGKLGPRRKSAKGK
jgi:hypothetical protein